MPRYSGFEPSHGEYGDYYEPRSRHRHHHRSRDHNHNHSSHRRGKDDKYHYNAAFVYDIIDTDEGWISRVLMSVLFWFMLLSLTGLVIAILVIYILGIKDNSAIPDQDNLDFQLYKNTRFGECASANETVVDCSYLRFNLAADRRGFTDFAPNPTENYMVKPWLPANKSNYDGPRYTWCDVAGCLRDFKVVPSKPRDSAFYMLSITTMQFVTMTIWSSSFWLWKLWNANPEDRDGCGQLGITFWVPAIGDAASVLFWWANLFKQASGPLNFGPPSILNWVTMWRYARSLHFHPVECAFDYHSSSRRVLMWILYSLAIIQWIASCVVYGIYSGDITSMFGRGRYARYDCLADKIDTAPGVSSCSATELCSKDWLLGDPGFQQSIYYGDFMVAIFWISTVVAILPILCLLGEGFDRWYHDKSFFSSRYAEHLKKYSSNASVEAALLGLFGPVLVIVIMTIVSIVKEASEYERLGTFAFDLSCRAVHVSMSPWKYWLDVNDYGRAYEVTKHWFNV
ncbi:hypothetical protein F5Y11DRAFT_131416 [Daldinia sp. FL1419]|nr:hypothetical protein F5Y11DRAFT_131416 [Daldinia sp. FL1419]